MKRPNILFIMADQMAAPILPMHDPASPIKLPHLSQLAASGVVFDSAYCNSPLCAPSRFTLVSGQLPSSELGRARGTPELVPQHVVGAAGRAQRAYQSDGFR